MTREGILSQIELFPQVNFLVIITLCIFSYVYIRHNLAYIAYTSPPLSRQERVAAHQDHIFSIYRDQQREFLRFVLDQYSKAGVDELDDNKLPALIELKCHGVADAVSVLGSVADIRDTFISFQKHLYARKAAM